MRLFNAVVTPVVLYGSASWTMTHVREQKLKATQRKMLRTILGKGRRILNASDVESGSTADSAASDHAEALESWVEWVQRVTREATAAMSKAGVPDWSEEQQRRKWRWCGHTCRRLDSRWSTALLKHMPIRGHRCRGHPFSRWSDDLEFFLTGALHLQERADYGTVRQMAESRDGWANLEGDFVAYCVARKWQ